MAANEKLRKEMDELQKTVKTLMVSVKKSEVMVQENKRLKKEMEAVKKEFADERERSVTMTVSSRRGFASFLKLRLLPKLHLYVYHLLETR